MPFVRSGEKNRLFLRPMGKGALSKDQMPKKKDEKMETHNNKNIRGNIEQPLNSVEDTLKDSELRYRRLFETAQDGILIIDADTGRIVDANPYLSDLLCYSHDEFIGKALWHFGPFKDIRINRAAFQDLRDKGYIRYEHLPLESKGGRRVEVEFISNVYQVDRKRMIQCNIRDNSRRKRGEEKRLRLETQLKQAQKMEAVATLAAGIAHQFNNALTIITGGLGLFAEERLPEKNGHLQPMIDAAEKMARLTRQLLAYARAGRFRNETLSLSDLVAESLPLSKPARRPIKIETEFSLDLPSVNADRNQMQMALLAVLANASEAIETEGLIRITGRRVMLTDEGVKPFSTVPSGTYACLTVEDNGQGMKEDTRGRVFEPFFTTHFPGRGLGMAAVYGIVKNHDGWISVVSQLGVGTSVAIWLPALLEIDEKMEKIEIHPNGMNNVASVDEKKTYAERK
jgi:two-component system cell cycle sensor histidine kinase/response regulator CckA